VDLLLQARDTILLRGPTTNHNDDNTHYRPRIVSLERQRLSKLRKQIVNLLRAETVSDTTDLPAEVQSALNDSGTQVRRHSGAGAPLPLHDQLKGLKVAIRKQIQSIDRQHQTQAKQRMIMKRQALYDRRQKIGNQIITGQYKGRNSMQLRALYNDASDVVIAPDQVMETIERYYTSKMIPAQGSGTKTGLYLPEHQPRTYPWMQEGCPNPFELATSTSTGMAPKTWLHDKIADKQAFEACLKSLSKGKAPGPDGITNEMLNLLPIQAQEMLHAYIQLMWATAYTPHSWKESLTVLLYKNKGTPFQLQYYRRIGLENTIYKRWTRMITWTLADYAERHNILSYTQGGFRNKRTYACFLHAPTTLTVH
jgi:hypothetical protein